MLAEARQQAVADATRRPMWRSGPAYAVAAAAITLVLGGVLLATRLLFVDTSPTATVPDGPTVSVTTTMPTSRLDAGAADEVFDVAVAPDGSLWAATAAGVVAWDLEASSPTVFTEAEGLGGREVSHVAVAADGTVWAVGDEWLAHYDGTWTVITDEFSSPVGGMAVGPDGTVWVAADGDSLIRIDADGATTYSVPEAWRFADPWARSIAVDRAGTVWASTWLDGVLAFDGEWRHYGVEDGLPGDVVGDVVLAPDGSVWFGGDGLYGDPDGDIAAAGIARFDGSTWTSFTTADGLLSNEGAVAIGSDGNVWVIHTSLPAEVADALGVHLPSGLSLYDGIQWLSYPNISVGDGRGAVVSADGTLWMPVDGGILGFDGTTSRLLVAGADAVPPLSPVGPAVSLEPVDGLEPVRYSTSIGEIEFTTWAIPDETETLSAMTETGHGAIANLPPDGTPAWSIDGITWKAIRLSVEPYGWSDQAATYGDDLFAFVDAGVGRMVWDGAGWVETEIIPAPSVDRGAIGPRGIVAIRGERVYFWDGAEFSEATEPPDRSLYPGPSAGCSAPGWNGEGIMAELGPVVATDDGFIALAARSEADWYRTPVCEPLVWLSNDGDTWTPTSEESPFEKRSFIVDMAVVGNRIVAVGGTSRSDAAAWVSDDGITWERSDLRAAQVWQVAGSARGWIAVGNQATDTSGDGTLDGDMWFSADGLVWDGPYERPRGWGDFTGLLGVAMLDDRVVGSGEWTNSMAQGSPAAVVIGEITDD